MWRQCISLPARRRLGLVPPRLDFGLGLAREDPVAFLFEGLQLFLLVGDSVGGPLLVGRSGTAGGLLGEFAQIFPGDLYPILDLGKGWQDFRHSLLL